MTYKQFLKREGKPYSDWFGRGNTKTDTEEMVAHEGIPLQILESTDSPYMICLVYKDKIIVNGYDGNEYTHTFTFPR